MSLQAELSKVFLFSQNKIPGQLIIQITDHCNATCPQCGMRKTAEFRRSKLDIDQIKRYIDKAVENGVEAMSFTGGEPMLFLNDLVEMINYAGAAGIKYIRTGTNGYLLRKGKSKDEFDTRIKRVVEKIVSTPVRNFWISIDSACFDTHERMRGFDGLIEGIAMAVPLFHEAGLYPSANLGINRNLGGAVTESLWSEDPDDEEHLDKFYIEFKDAFDQFYRTVIDMGFSIVNMCYPMSVPEGGTDLQSVYTATSIDKIVNFSRGERLKLFTALIDTVPKYRSQIRIFTPMSSLYTLKKQYEDDAYEAGYPCRGGIDFFFVDSQDGQTYPCGFRGNESFGEYDKLDMETIDRNAFCTKCDWECFRDPSVLFGPFIEGVRQPLQLLRKFSNRREFLDLWRKDLAYYESCDLFDGRKPISYNALRKFNLS